ncbi:hypothetical protein [Stackebrandtia soli]|uniref:hypothetical protein n=1 Tax=Stackebrandtia soli TaxID=1892856 RepID=UPI0039ED22C6
MTQPPQWWNALVADPITRHYGIDWHDPSDWKPAVPQSWSGCMSTPRLRERDELDRSTALRVGTGPATPVRRPDGSHVEWYLQDGTLRCALGPRYDGWLWIDVEPTATGITTALDAIPARLPTLVDLPSIHRGFIGLRPDVLVPDTTSGTFVPLSEIALIAYFAGVGYVDLGTWGSAHLDDPYPDGPHTTATPAHRTGRPGRIPSRTWRTAQSRSYVSIEIHNRQIVCAAVRYRPTPVHQHPIVAAFNEATGSDHPHDLPLDVVGALTGFDLTTKRGLEHAETSTPEETATVVRILAALASGDLASATRLRDYVDHPEPGVRLALAGTAAWYGYRFLLDELAHHEPDPQLRIELEALIIEGTRPDRHDPFDDDLTAPATT